MRLKSGIVVVLLAFVAGGLPLARAQQSPSPRATIVGISDGTYPNATALVNVEDPSGADVKGLGASNFTVTVDGEPATVISADLASSKALPLDVLLLVDVSGSMAGGAIASVRESAKAFVATLAPDDRVAVASFADSVTLLLDFTTDRGQAQAAIDGLSAAGNTALYQATALSAQKIAASSASRRAVVLLSDGAQDGVPLTVTRDDALKAAASAGVPFFTIGEGTNIDRDYLQALAGVTHGQYLEAPNPSDIGTVYSGIGRLLRDQYAVTFDASGVNPAGSSIVLTLSVGTAKAEAVATYKPGPAFAPPPLAIDGLRDGEELSGARAITVSGTVPSGGVTFYVDDVNVGQATASPYTFTLDPARIAAGPHTLRVVAAASVRPLETTLKFSSVRPAAKNGGGGGLPLLPIAGVAGAVLLLVLVAAVVLRLRSMPGNAPDVSLDRVLPFAPRGDGPEAQQSDTEVAAVPESIGEPMGVLVSREGADFGSEYPVGGRPVSIGSAATCGVRVDDPDLSGEEARIWISKGRLMLHRMTHLSTMMVDGSSGGWQILDPGDSFEVGGHRFEFRLLAPARPEPAPGDVPNVLRDADPSRPRMAPPILPTSAGPMPMPEASRSNLTDMMPRDD